MIYDILYIFVKLVTYYSGQSTGFGKSINWI